MNKELIKNAKDFRDRISKLIDVAEKCNTAIEGISHGADIEIVDRVLPDINLNTCHLDDGQEALIQQLLIGVLRNKMEYAEAELEMLPLKKEKAKA